MVTEALFVLALFAILTLEADHLLLEDFLVGKTQEELTVKLELRGGVKSASNQTFSVFQQLHGKIILLLHDHAILRVADVKTHCHRQALKVNIYRVAA